MVSDGFVSEFEELFRIAYRTAYAILGDRGDAEDCAQEALIAVGHTYDLGEGSVPELRAVS